jgi:hypothetical protein
MYAIKKVKSTTSTKPTMQQQPVFIGRYLVEESGENGCRMEEGDRQSILRFA